VEGNRIGLNADGSEALPNASDGVSISNAPNNTVGGTTSGARNIISGNGDDGVKIVGSTATDNQVLGNFIGTDANGTADRGNIGDGVKITSSAENNTIGGTAAGARNVISGNQADGVEIRDDALSNEVEGNYIGTTATGNAALGNTGDGVDISDADDNTIGGTVSTARNIISANIGDGVVIFTPSTGNEATGNKVQGNFIGTNAAGNAALGNDDGVAISSASDNTIGSTIGSTSGGNRIAFNDQDGVFVSGGLAVGNSILSNFIHSNGETGIDLVGGIEDSFGVTANDGDNPTTAQIDPDSDAPTSSNHRQNFPVITSATRSASTGDTTISGTLKSNPNQTYDIQCFLAAQPPAVPDPSGHGEGQFLMDQETVQTDANGDGSFSCSSPILQVGQVVSATATNTSGTANGTSRGDTSEFSENETVVAGT
jgi:hypothetical protein